MREAIRSYIMELRLGRKHSSRAVECRRGAHTRSARLENSRRAQIWRTVPQLG